MNPSPLFDRFLRMAPALLVAVTACVETTPRITNPVRSTSPTFQQGTNVPAAEAGTTSFAEISSASPEQVCFVVQTVLDDLERQGDLTSWEHRLIVQSHHPVASGSTNAALLDSVAVNPARPRGMSLQALKRSYRVCFDQTGLEAESTGLDLRLMPKHGTDGRGLTFRWRFQ